MDALAITPPPAPDEPTAEALAECSVQVAIIPIPAPDESAAEALVECWAKIGPALHIAPAPGAGTMVVASVDGTAIHVAIACIAQVAPTAVPLLCKGLEAWLSSRANRKVSLKVGPNGVAAEGQTPEQVKELVAYGFAQLEIHGRNQNRIVIP